MSAAPKSFRRRGRFATPFGNSAKSSDAETAMIAKGNTHSSGLRLARYMIRAKDGERVERGEVRGFASDEIVDAFRSVDAMAEGTRGEKPLFHVQVRNRDGEHLTPE